MNPSFINEGESATVGIMRRSSTNNSSVSLNLEGDAAAFAAAFEAAGRKLEFAPGESWKWVAIHAHDDLEVVRSNVVRLTLADPLVGGATIPDVEAILTVLDNDVGTLAGESRGDEHTGLTFTLTRLKGLQHAATLTYRTRRDADPATTAIAGVDYVESSGTVTFQPGETTRKIRIETLDNQRTETKRRWLVLEFESASPFLPGNSFRLELPDDEPLWVWPNQPRPSRVSEGGVIRLQLTRYGELAGDTRVSLRHRMMLRPCDGSSWGEGELGLNGLPSGWQLVGEGTTAAFGPRDRTLWLELMAPDDTELQATNRCLTVILDSPNRPDAISEWALDLALDDNETRFVEGSTGGIPGPWLEPGGSFQARAFAPLPDGSAYVLVTDWEGLEFVLSRIRPELDLDPEFRPEIPPGLIPAAIAPKPDGGLIVAASNGTTRELALLSLDRRGRAKPDFRPVIPLEEVLVMKSTPEGLIYLTDGTRVVRLTPEGKPDLAFQEPGIHGSVNQIWLDGPTAYLGGRFTHFAGIQYTNLGLVRLLGNGVADPDFVGLVRSANSGVQDVIPLQTGRLLVHEPPYLQVRGTNGEVVASDDDDYGRFARLDDGRVFRATVSRFCGHKGCNWERSLRELRSDIIAADEWIDVLPATRGFTASDPGTDRIFAAGDYLWIEQQASLALPNYQRLRFLRLGETAFGLVPANEAQLASQGGRLIGAVRRYVVDSDSAAATTVRVSLGRSDSTTRFEPFEVPVIFAAGEVTKPILLPEWFHFTPDSLSEVQLSLDTPAGGRRGGIASMTSRMVGVPEQSTSYRLTVHRWSETKPGELPLLSVTGPHGSFRVDACTDLNATTDPWAWTEVYRTGPLWLWDDAPVFRLSPDAPAAVVTLPSDINGDGQAFFRAGADE